MSEQALKDALVNDGNVYAITTIWAAIFLFPMIFISGEFSKMEARARRRRPAATAPLLSFMSPNYSHGAAQPPPPSPPFACTRRLAAPPPRRPATLRPRRTAPQDFKKMWAADGKPGTSGLQYNTLMAGLTFYLYNEVSTLALKKISGVTHSVANTAKRAIIIVGCAIAFGAPRTLPPATSRAPEP